MSPLFVELTCVQTTTVEAKPAAIALATPLGRRAVASSSQLPLLSAQAPMNRSNATDTNTGTICKGTASSAGKVGLQVRAVSMQSLRDLCNLSLHGEN